MPSPRYLVLLVEDDPDHRLLITLALQQSGLGIRIWAARSGEVALEYLLGDPPVSYLDQYPRPDLVILDLGLPGISGFDLLRMVRGSERRSDVPVLVLTVSDDQEDRRLALALGASAFLSKPADFAEIMPVVRDLLSDAHGKTALRGA